MAAVAAVKPEGEASAESEKATVRPALSQRSDYLLALAFGQGEGGQDVPTFVPTEIGIAELALPPAAFGGVVDVDAEQAIGLLPAAFDEAFPFLSGNALAPALRRAVASWQSLHGPGSPLPSPSPPLSDCDATVPSWLPPPPTWPTPSLRVPRTPLGPRAAIPTMGNPAALLAQAVGERCPGLRLREEAGRGSPPASGPSSPAGSAASGHEGPAVTYLDGTPWSRDEALRRYRDKRGRRCFERRVLYGVRRDAATKRVRVNGRFVSRRDAESLLAAAPPAPA